MSPPRRTRPPINSHHITVAAVVLNKNILAYKGRGSKPGGLKNTQKSTLCAFSSQKARVGKASMKIDEVPIYEPTLAQPTHQREYVTR